MPPPPPEYWSTDQPDEVRVRNRYATHARLAPAGIPTSADGEEYYVVELQRNYSKEWPSIKTTADGSVVFRPGFLAPLTDPDMPAYFFYRGIERFTFSASEQAVRNAVAALLVVAHVAAACALWRTHPSLTAAIVFSYARDSLSFGKWALLLGLAACGKMWLYWAFLAGKLADEVLAKYAPPIRKFMWANFAVWMAYNLLSPLHWHPLPFWPFAPGSGGLLEATPLIFRGA